MTSLPCSLPEGHEGDCKPRAMAISDRGLVPLPFAHPSPLWDDVMPGHPRCEGTVEVGA